MKIKFLLSLLLLILVSSTLFSTALEPVNLKGVNSAGRFLVPMRSIFESLDATVQWEGTTKTVTGMKGNTEVTLKIDDTSAYINDKLITLDVPATIVDGRTYVPARFVGEALGADVGWDGTKRRASVSLGDTLLHIYEELPPEPEIIESDNISHVINPRVVKNGGSQKISLEATITDDNGSPVENANVQFFVSSRDLDRNSSVVYESNTTDENGLIRASYTTSAMDNDRQFIVRVAANVDNINHEAINSFLVTNEPYARVIGTAYHPLTGLPASNVLITASHRDPHVYKEITVTDVNGKYDAFIPISDREYFIGASFENDLLDINHVYDASHSYISSDRFSLELGANINKSNEVYEYNFTHGLVQGRTHNNAKIYAIPYVNGVPKYKEGIAFEALTDGTYLVPLPEGTYEFVNIRNESTMKSGIIVKKGKTTDLGTHNR